MGIGIKRSEASGSGRSAATVMSQVRSLFSGFNANKKGDIEGFEEGVVGEQEPLLTLQMEDEELIKLSSTWKSEYDSYFKDIKQRQENNYKYWKGQQYEIKATDTRGIDNVIFESFETLLPLISRQNPEPNVEAENTDDGIFVSEKTAEILFKKADETRLKSKIKMAARQWGLYFIGCFKMGWDSTTNDMYFQVINPEKLILDPTGEFDGGEFRGRYIGEYKTTTAEELINTFPNSKDIIMQSVDGKLGTTVGYHEWWTNDYVFWRYKGFILDKRENPYWNGSQETKGMDEYGNETVSSVDGVNHFASPKMPYSFLSVFTTGKQPHDETSLIEQVISLQDIVNKRVRQIDKNADDTNNGWVFNKDFDQDQAKTALNSLRNGGAIIATTDVISDSVMRLTAPPLAPYIYNDLVDKREQVYNIMGIRGSTAQGILGERTVRGKIEIKGQDTDRLALIVEQIEQFIDHLYNLAVQTIYVYYDEQQVARAIGQDNAARYLQILKGGPSRRLVVSVKEGSMIPKDPMVRRNEAIDLWNSRALTPEMLYEQLDFPDPRDSAKELIEYTMNPQMMLQELSGGVPMAGVPGMPVPAGMEQQPVVSPGMPINGSPNIQ